MTRLTKVLIAAVVTTAALPAAAPASQHAQPRDTMLDKQAARAAAGATFAWSAADGHRLRLQLSKKLGRTPASVATIERLAALLETFHHGPEMSQLKLHVVHPSEMAHICGAEGVLGCYGGDELVVPDRSTADIPLEEVLAHEYGHHLAAHRRNSMGSALAWGPQTWASTEAVCWRADSGRLFNGYWDNPGEAFAEAYARLHYPASTASWDYTKLLEPGGTSLDAIVFDAHNQLSRTPSRTVFSGRLSRSRRTQTFSLTLAQDSTLRLALAGPAGADYDVRLKTPGYRDEVTRAYHARDRLNTTACFADGAPKTVTMRVTRHRGAGRFRLTASYFDRYDPLP